MVVKINYNSKGDGSILWRLGPQGDFVASSVPAGQTAYQFFNSHEHDAEYDSLGNITMFDNGNTRQSLYGGHSRGQAWQINESAMTATPVVDLDLGAYSMATGSAQRLANNNYHFYLGYIGPNSRSVELTTATVDKFELAQPNTLGYLSFRMNTLYSLSGELVYTPFYLVPPGN
jgi:arylsulfate sulfotransferase